MDGVEGSVCCSEKDYTAMNSWLIAECKTIIWNHSPPQFSDPSYYKQIANFHITLSHGGDILDEEYLALIVTKATKQFSKSTATLKSIEGDYVLFETISQMNEEVDIQEECSFIYNGKLCHISENFVQSSELPLLINDEMIFSNEIQEYFCVFLKKIADTQLYHRISLFIPEDLKKLLLFDENLISKVVESAKYSLAFNPTHYNFVEYQIKFRKFQFAYLNSMDVRISQKFGELIEDKPYQYIKLSYLMSVGFQEVSKIPEMENDILNSKTLQDYMKDEAKHPDDDDSWLDTKEKPSISVEDVGQEMAERVGTFLKEVSNFDTIDTEGPINFDIDSFAHKLEHFLDSSSSEEEEEEEDQLLEHLEDEDKVLKLLMKDKQESNKLASNLFAESMESQPAENGPATELLTLFHMKKDQ